MYVWRGGVVFFIFAFLVACSQSGNSVTSPTPAGARPTSVPPDTDTMETVLADVKSLLASDMSSARDWGFANRQEIDAATFGRPARISLLSPPAIRSYQPGARVMDLTVDQREWAVPLLVDGDLHVLVFIRENGDWGMSSTFSMVLPSGYDDPANNVVFLTTRQVGVDLILFERDNQERLAVARTPAPHESLVAKGHQPHPPEELMPALKQAVRGKCGWLFRRC